jgi:uncharacterized repeat protein (TIGR01451 family)
MRLRSFAFALASMIGSLPARAEPLAIPLRIQEALAPDPRQAPDAFHLIAGMDRAHEVVSFGLPLPASRIMSVSQLGLSGAEAGQFRVLERWPDGSIEWVLIDAQVSLAAGTANTGVSLVDGMGNFGGPDLARDMGDEILIDTGAVGIAVKKHGFNLIDRATIQGTDIVVPGTSPGIVLTGNDDTPFTAANDPSAEVVVEENGPLRAVVRAKGTHYAQGGMRNLDFTVRMHFYKGKSRVKVAYTLRNASKQQVENASFKSLELALGSNLQGTSFAFANDAGETTGTLAPGERAAIFQGENVFPNVRDFDLDATKYPTGIQGWAITQGSSTLASGTRDQFIDLFYARASGADGRTLIAGTRFAAGWWPQGLTIADDGSVRVGLFPPGNDRPYYARFTAHTTREVVFDFGLAPDPAEARATLFAIQYPLVGKAKDYDVYNQSGALWEKIVSFADEAAYYRSNGWPDMETKIRRPAFTIYRHWYWGETGGTNQYDFAKVHLHCFLRQDEIYGGAYYVNAEQRFLYNADLAVVHTDDYDYRHTATEVPSLVTPNGLKTFNDLPNAEHMALQKVIFELEHRHSYGMSLYYYLSGDERFKETYADWGEYLQTRGTDDTYVRGLAWNIYNMVDLYRFTHDEAYRALAWQWFQTDVLRAGGLHEYGTDWNRGFYIDRDVSRGRRAVLPFMIGTMLPRTYGYFLDYAAKEPVQIDRARDVLEGITRFVDHELWYEYSSRPGDYGLPYSQLVDEVPPADPRTVEGWYGGLKEVYPSYYFGYLLTGDPNLLRRAELLEKSSAYNTPSSYWFQDLPDRQTLQHLIQHPDLHPHWNDLPVSAANNGDGSWTLSWVVPPGTTEYRIKYSDRTIVPWLDYDRYTQAYTVDPAANVAFFAAENVADEPSPAAPGSTQTFVVRGLDAMKTYDFKARYFTGTKQLPSSLQLTVRAPESVIVGDAFVYHVEIQNTATTTVGNVVASDLIPSTVHPGALPASCTPMALTGALSCSFGAIAAGAKIAFDVPVSAARVGDATTVVTVVSIERGTLRYVSAPGHALIVAATSTGLGSGMNGSGGPASEMSSRDDRSAVRGVCSCRSARARRARGADVLVALLVLAAALVRGTRRRQLSAPTASIEL